MAELQVHVAGSSIAMLQGQRPPFRLLVRASEARNGRRLDYIKPAVSDAFVVCLLTSWPVVLFSAVTVVALLVQPIPMFSSHLPPMYTSSGLFSADCACKCKLYADGVANGIIWSAFMRMSSLVGCDSIRQPFHR